MRGRGRKVVFVERIDHVTNERSNFAHLHTVRVREVGCTDTPKSTQYIELPYPQYLYIPYPQKKFLHRHIYGGTYLCCKILLRLAFLT